MANTKVCITDGCTNEVKRSTTCKKCYQKAYHANRRATDAAYRDRVRVTLNKSREVNRDNPDFKTRKRSHNLNYLYGITQDQYLQQLRRQCGLCAVCRTHKEDLVVDHDHTTGAVRGLLCRQCNAGLGQFYDNVESLKHAVTYLNAGGDFRV